MSLPVETDFSPQNKSTHRKSAAKDWLQDHRTKAGNHVWWSPSPTPPLKQGHLEQVVRDHAQLKISKDGDSTTSLLASDCPHRKERFFPVFNWDLLYFRLCPLPHIHGLTKETEGMCVSRIDRFHRVSNPLQAGMLPCLVIFGFSCEQLNLNNSFMLILPAQGCKAVLYMHFCIQMSITTQIFPKHTAIAWKRFWRCS